MAKMTMISLIVIIQFAIATFTKHRKLMLNYNKSYSHINTILLTPFVGATKTIIEYPEIARYAYQRHHKRKI